MAGVSQSSGYLTLVVGTFRKRVIRTFRCLGIASPRCRLAVLVEALAPARENGAGFARRKPE